MVAPSPAPPYMGGTPKRLRNIARRCPTSHQSRPPIRPPSTRGKISDLTAASPCRDDRIRRPASSSISGPFCGDRGFKSRSFSGARGGPNRADPRRRLDADVDRRRRFQFFGLSSVQLEDAPGRYWPLELVEELSGLIDLGVMLAVREDAHLVEVFGKPGGADFVWHPRHGRRGPHRRNDRRGC